MDTEPKNIQQQLLTLPPNWTTVWVGLPPEPAMAEGFRRCVTDYEELTREYQLLYRKHTRTVQTQQLAVQALSMDF